MPLYESVFIARQDVSGQQVEGLADNLAKVIEEQGGNITKRESWGLRPLAFRIKKNRKAHYVMFNIDAPATAVVEYERQMRLNEDILRYMTVRVEALEEGPSAILQSRSGREERGGRRGDRDRGDRDRGERDRGDRDRGDRDRGDRDRGGRERSGRDRDERERGGRAREDSVALETADDPGGEE